jgi:hypothetical protein
MEEIFKDVPNYEGLYQVSNLGNVFSVKKGNIKKRSPRITNNYLRVNLCKNGVIKDFFIHQLVAMAFFDHMPNGMSLVVNHKNFNKLDNRVENLEIVSVRENSNLKHIKSSSKFVGVSWNKNIKKWVSYLSIKKKKIHLGYFDCEIKASEAYQNKLKEIKNPL